jgi:polyisoprenyl-teichoic acid--peptidoglycan teichoic acid transferase
VSSLKTTPPNSPLMPGAQKPKTSHARRWLMLSLSLVGVAIASATAGAILAVSLASTPLLQNRLMPDDADVFSEEESISTDTNFRLPKLTRPVTIMLLGVKVLSTDLANPPEGLEDLGYQALVDSFEGLSDTMMLLRFSPEQQKISVLSIPRDTRTYVEGVGVTKLNTANAYGGPALAATATSELLDGVEIDRYVRINVQGVEKLIDALGGVTLYVPRDMKYTDESQHLYINLKQGEQHLNGDQVLQFLRFRYDENGDIGRVQRQQVMIRALIQQALNPKTLTRLPRILSVIQDNVDTNLSIEELVALVGFGVQADRSNIQMLMLPGNFSAPGQYDLSYWIPDADGIKTLTAQYFGQSDDEISNDLVEDESRSARSVRVAIQNSTNREETVEQVVRHLSDAGYSRVYEDKPWQEPLKTTRIVAQQGDEAAAAAVQQALGLGEVWVESTGSLQSDVTIQLGQDWQQRLSTLESPSPES